MIKNIFLVVLLFFVWSCQTSSLPNKEQNDRIAYTNKGTKTEIVDSIKNDNRQAALLPDLDRYIHTDTLYPSSKGKGIFIQNSYPKGGSYIDPIGNKFGYGVFWTRVSNETASPFELTVNFPADSFAIFSPSDSYFKLFLPRDLLTLDKLSMIDYGVTDVQLFLDTGLNKPTRLQKTIKPKEAYLFYVGLLFHAPQQNGPVRTELVLKGQALFYSIRIAPDGSGIIPCGKIAF